MSSRSAETTAAKIGALKDSDVAVSPRFREAAASPQIEPDSDAECLLNDLRVHQITLEMQNQELRESQLALERARSRYFELFDFAPVPYFVFDDRHSVQELNLAASELLGGDRTHFKHRPFFAHILEADRPHFHQHVSSVLTRREREEVELRIVRSDGSSQMVRLVSQAVSAEGSDKPVCLSGGLILGSGPAPVIQQGAPVQAWQEHLSHAGIGVALTSPARGWVQINSALCQMLGYSEAELRRQTWVALTHPSCREVDADNFNRLLAGETDFYRLEKPLIRRSGTLLRARVTVTCSRGEKGAIESLFHTVEEIRENVPVIGVGNASASWVQRLTDAENRAFVATQPVVRNPVVANLNDLLSHLRERWTSVGEFAAVRWNLAQSLLSITCDIQGLETLLANLLINSREALGRISGGITVSTGLQHVESDLFDSALVGYRPPAGEYAFLEVVDEGLGMDSVTQSQIFETGFTSKPGRLGLGLKVVLAIVRAHCGGLRVFS